MEQFATKIERAAYNGGIAARVRGVELEFCPFRDDKSNFTTSDNMRKMKDAWEKGWKVKNAEMLKEGNPK